MGEGGSFNSVGEVIRAADAAAAAAAATTATGAPPGHAGYGTAGKAGVIPASPPALPVAAGAPKGVAAAGTNASARRGRISHGLPSLSGESINIDLPVDSGVLSSPGACSLIPPSYDGHSDATSFLSDVELLWNPGKRNHSHRRIGGASIIFNTLQSTMGAGILSHAACFEYCGVIPALCILICVAVCVGFSVKLLLSTVILFRSLPSHRWPAPLRASPGAESAKLLPEPEQGTPSHLPHPPAGLISQRGLSRGSILSVAEGFPAAGFAGEVECAAPAQPDEAFCTFEGIGEACFGAAGRRWVQLTYIGMGMVAMTSFLVPLKSFLMIVLSNFAWFDGLGFTPAYCLLAALGLVMVPLACLRNVGRLWVTSLVGTLCLTIFVIASIIMTSQYEAQVAGGVAPTLHCRDAPSGEDTPTGDVQLFKLDIVQTLIVISILSCSYVCQLSLFPIFREVRLADGDVGGASKVFRCTSISLVLITLLYGSAGASGYIMWRDVSSRASSILACYDSSKPAILAVYIGMCVCLMCAFPLVLVSCRGSVSQILFNKGNEETTLREHLATTFALVVPVATVGLAVHTLSSVLGVGGAFAAPPLTFLIPPACYIYAHCYVGRVVEEGEANVTLNSRLYTGAIVLLSVGVVVQVTCIIGAFLSVFG